MKVFKEKFFRKMGVVSCKELQELEMRLKAELQALKEENVFLKNKVEVLLNEVVEVEMRYKRILKKNSDYLKNLEKGLALIQTNSLISDLKSIIIKKK